MANRQSNSPERTYRVGNVSASIFVNETGSGRNRRDFRSVTLQKSYLDGDERKYTGSLNLGDLPNAIRVLQLASNHVEREEADVTQG